MDARAGINEVEEEACAFEASGIKPMPNVGSLINPVEDRK
jgi:hypothetical protein